MLPIDPWLFWLILTIVMLIVEFITVGFFSITIAAGALLSMMLSLVTPVVWVQVAVFLISSVVFFFTLKPFMQKLFPIENETKTAVDRIIGKTCRVTVEIYNINGTGQVTVDGDIWSARSKTGEKILVDTLVKIIAVEGVKVIVEVE